MDAHWPLKACSAVGRWGINGLQHLGAFVLFMLSGFYTISSVNGPGFKIRQQIFFIGVKSLPVILLVGLFTGMVLGLQGQYTLSQFGSEGLLGSAVALTLVRELGPVLTGFMVVGQAGSSMTSEIGIMRNSEQIDAFQTLAINPIGFLVAPRIFAALICFPFLTAIFDLIGLFGGYLTGILLMGGDAGSYWYRVDASLAAMDVVEGFSKSLVFGLLTTSICCYYGFLVNQSASTFGSKGVSKVTTAAVVTSSIVILASDFIITSLFLT